MKLNYKMGWLSDVVVVGVMEWWWGGFQLKVVFVWYFKEKILATCYKALNLNFSHSSGVTTLNFSFRKMLKSLENLLDISSLKRVCIF